MSRSDWGNGLELLDLVHESIFARDLDLTITYWNAAAEDLYGWSRQEAAGRRADELLQCIHPVPLAEREAQLFATGHWQGEFERVTKSGARRIIEATWSVRRDGAGNPIEVIETGRDITERRKAVQALAASEQKYRNLFDYMPIALWQLDSRVMRDMFDRLREKGIQDLPAFVAAHPDFLDRAQATLRVTEVNEQALELFGASDREALLERMPVLWLTREDWAGAAAARLSGAKSYRAESRIVRFDGSETEVMFSVAFADRDDPGSLNLVGAIDIGDRLDAERRLQQLQADFAHAARVATLGELTASIAHEVNQPLAAIATNAEASLRWLARDEPDLSEIRSLAVRTVAEARRAADIITRIRAMASHHTPTPEPVSVNELVEDMLGFMQREFRVHGVTVEFDAAPRLPPVLADRTQLQQVLVNLGVNAVQAMADCDGECRLAIRTGNDGQGRIRIELEDTGPGIAPELLPQLFDSFVTTKRQGLGIGLSICRSIVEAHGGDIRAENLPTGARFVCSLPAADGAAAKPVPEAPAQAAEAVPIGD